MKIRTYKIIDIAILSAIAAGLEMLNMFFYKRFEEVFSLSIMLPIAIIVMARWRAYAAITAAITGAVYAFATGASSQIYVIYIFGNLFILLNLLWFTKMNKKSDKIFTNKYQTILFVLSAFLAVNIGRTFLAALFGSPPLASFIKFLYSDAFNVVMGLIIVFIATKQDGLTEYQPSYLLRTKTPLDREDDDPFKDRDK